MHKPLLAAAAALLALVAGVPSAKADETPSLRVTAITTNKTYGTAMTLSAPEYILSVEGTNGTQTVTGIDVSFTNAVGEAADPTAANAPAGTYGIRLQNISGTGLEVFEDRITYVPGVLTVEKAPLEVTIRNKVKDYGRTAGLVVGKSGFKISSGALASGDALVSLTLESDGAAATAAYKAEGYPITASAADGTGLENYQITYVPGTLTVEKLALTLTAKDATKLYGEALAFDGTEFKVTAGELVNGDTVDSVTLASNGAAVTAPYKAEGYPIALSNPQGKGLGNYTFSCKDGHLDMTKRTMTVTAVESKKCYGDELVLSDLEYVASIEGTNGLETVTGIDVSFTNGLGEAAFPTNAAGVVGTYGIYLSNLRDFDLSGYVVTYVPGSLEVTQAVLTVTALDDTKTHGDAKSLTKYKVEGLKNGDAVTSVTLTSAGTPAAAAYKPEGYAITPSNARGKGLENYRIAYADGTLRCGKRPVTVAAVKTKKCYGEELVLSDLRYVASIKGTNGLETVTGIDVAFTDALGAEVFPTNAVGAAGAYGIRLSNLRDFDLSGYDVTYVAGSLEVTKAALKVTAVDDAKSYGEEKPLTKYRVEGLKNGDKVTSVTLTSAGSAAGATCRTAGYPIVASAAKGTGLGNYALTYVNGTLTTDRVPLTIAAEDAAKGYGDVLAFEGTEFTVAGELRNGEKVTAVRLTSDKAASSGTVVGTYEREIVPSEATGISASNYDITFSSGTLTVTQALLAVTVNDATWRVGRSRPAAGFADFSSQLKAGDGVADVTGGSGAASDVRYTYARWGSDKPTGADVGTYRNEVGLDLASLRGPKAANYLVTVASGSLTVISALENTICDRAEAAATTADATATTTYDGVFYEGDSVAGTVQVKLAKASRKTGLGKLTAQFAPLGSKKVTVTGQFDPLGASVEATAKDGRVLKLVIGADGLYGTFGDWEIECARNRYSSKDAVDKLVVADAEKWIGAYALAGDSPFGWNTYLVSVAKKGKVKVSGTYANGVKFTASVQMIIGDRGCCIPVVSSKAGEAFCIWLAEDGTEVTDLDGAVFGKATNIADTSVFAVDVAAVKGFLEDDATSVLAEYVPDGADVWQNGRGKWVVMPDEYGKASPAGKLVWDRKAGAVNLEKSKIDGYNVSRLALNFTKKTGAFKGSFDVYTVAKGTLQKKSLTVNGVVIDGVGYGSAAIAKKAGVRLALEPNKE